MINIKRMGKHLTFLLVGLLSFVVVVGCDNQSNQQELEKQRQEDSIRVAENVKKELAEKEAAERAEREKQEAAERAEREEQEAAERADREERESNNWTGATSMEELRSKLEGTTWHCDYGGIMKKFHFSNGGITMISGRKGKWHDKHRYSSYKLEMHHLNNGNFVSVDFGEDEERMEYRSFSMAFMNKCMQTVLFHFGEPAGKLIYGDFEWNDDL